ncbi:MFS transporter [Desulfosporosinus sp. SB140]|uniref:MFS transporter n=1 Tax=Desulfosporosinus paludis TaxID=3115649 RepID=UPI00388F205A
MELSKSKSWIITLVLGLTWLIGYFDKAAINIALLPIAKEFGLKTTEMGIVMSSFFVSYAVMVLVGGYLADKYGAKKVIVLSLVAWSILTGTTGLAWSLVSLAVIRFFFGFAEASFPPASTVMVRDLFPMEGRAKAKSFIVSSAMLGSAVGSIAIGILCAKFGWRIGFWLLSGISILVVPILLYVGRGLQPKVVLKEKTKTDKALLFDVIKIPIVWKTIVIQICVGVFSWGMTSWMPYYWVTVKGLKLASVGFATAVPYIASFIWMNIAGWALDKFFVGRERIFIVFSLILSALFVYLTFSATTVAMGVAYMTLATVASSTLAAIPGILLLKYVRQDVIGLGLGIGSFGQQVMGIITPTLMGYLIATTNSYTAIMALVMGIQMIAAITSWTINTKGGFIKEDSLTVK